MSSLTPLVDLSSSLLGRLGIRWNRKLNEKKDKSGESDWLSERPESWYQGPLIFPTQLETSPQETWHKHEEIQEEYSHDSEGC